jgi:TonB family protein
MKVRQLASPSLGVLLGLSVLSQPLFASNVCTKHISKPDYPRLSWLAQLTGTVNVNIEVAADGTVSSALPSGAHNLLNRAAEENIRQWTFCPTSEGFRLKIIYVYQLKGQKEREQSPAEVSFDLPLVKIVAHRPAPGLEQY